MQGETFCDYIRNNISVYSRKQRHLHLENKKDIFIAVMNEVTLTFWRRIFFQILAHAVFKM